MLKLPGLSELMCEKSAFDFVSGKRKKRMERPAGKQVPAQVRFYWGQRY